MKRSYVTILTSMALAGASLPAAAAEVTVALEPVRVDFVEHSFIGQEQHGLEFSGTWAISKDFDLRFSLHDSQTPLTPVVSSPFIREYSSSGYSVAFSRRAFGPFELTGRVDVLNVGVDVATSNLKLGTLHEYRRITIAGATARWRPDDESMWGLEAGANRATGRPTFVGIGVFVSF